ncbi:hypothetical protein, partial [Micromonospora sp. TSRI0369]|uniref:hypothetical protein n=1 Tax=Micromonospora sp. TSRI0369 TaxID=1703936 RepID=UPI001A7E1487
MKGQSRLGLLKLGGKSGESLFELVARDAQVLREYLKRLSGLGVRAISRACLLLCFRPISLGLSFR